MATFKPAFDPLPPKPISVPRRLVKVGLYVSVAKARYDDVLDNQQRLAALMVVGRANMLLADMCTIILLEYITDDKRGITTEEVL